MTQTVTGLKLLLHSHSMNQSQLAELLGVSNSLVSHWATGKIKMKKETQDKIMEVVKNKNKPTPSPTIVAEKPEVIVEKVEPKKAYTAKTLEGKIKECKKYCLDSYGFEVIVVKMK